MEKPYAPQLPKTAPGKFIQEVTTELKKVTWPTRQETVRLTVTVLIISVAVGVFIGLLDISFIKLTSFLYK